MSRKHDQRKPRLKGNKQRRMLWPCIPSYSQD